MSQTDTRIAHLGKVIAANTKSISEFLDVSKQDLSLDSHADLPSDLASVRRSLLDATIELQQLILGPKEALFMWARNNQSTIQAVCEFDLARSFPLDEAASFADIAKVSGIQEHDVRRIIRHAATEGVFREEPKGFVRHTAASRMLAEDQVVRDYMDVCYKEIFPAMQHTVPAMRKWPQSQHASETGFSLTQPSHQSFFEYLSSHPDRAGKFASAMSAYTTGPEFAMSHVCNGYDWQSLGQATVVDIGGSTGYVSLALAKQFPNLKFVVQDTPATIADVSSSGRDEEEYKCVQFMPHDFFSEQPLTGVDVFLLRMILHDHEDAQCLRILRALIPGLKEGSRVVLIEVCLPEPGTLGILEEKQIRTMDMNMLSLFNARERDAEEWKMLFANAHPHFKCERIARPEGSALSIIEFSWREH